MGGGAPRARFAIVRSPRAGRVCTRPLNLTVRPHFAMRQYLKSVWVKVGLALLVVGAGPLLFIIVAAAVGLWPDPNPNPIGPGLLFGLTFWPAIICIVVGVVRVRNRRAA
ncbi:MAG: hypothetical protein AUH01_05735 [Acidobacteria bacterium 13_2_20CM_56_17]|nr:MAG: hypothetical protein AUH01_05735 [Acidobacteria bacterium 13_2_20CM_56_17]